MNLWSLHCYSLLSLSGIGKGLGQLGEARGNQGRQGLCTQSSSAARIHTNSLSCRGICMGCGKTLVRGVGIFAEISAQGEGHKLHIRLCVAEVATQISQMMFYWKEKGKCKETGKGKWKVGMRQEGMGIIYSLTSSVIFVMSITEKAGQRRDWALRIIC